MAPEPHRAVTWEGGPLAGYTTKVAHGMHTVPAVGLDCKLVTYVIGEDHIGRLAKGDGDGMQGLRGAKALGQGQPGRPSDQGGQRGVAELGR